MSCLPTGAYAFEPMGSPAQTHTTHDPVQAFRAQAQALASRLVRALLGRRLPRGSLEVMQESEPLWLPLNPGYSVRLR